MYVVSSKVSLGRGDENGWTTRVEPGNLDTAANLDTGPGMQTSGFRNVVFS